MNNFNIKNRTVFKGDNLEILRGINSDVIDLVYADPPFNKKKDFIAPMGSESEGAKFKDYFQESDIKESWLGLIADKYPTLYQYINGIGSIGHKSNKYYLCYMAVRIIEIHRVLKNTGSFYLHCDTTMSHYLKLLCDCIFGENNFRNEIAWCYKKMPNNIKAFQRNKDSLFLYTKTNQYIFNKQYSQPSTNSLKTFENAEKIGYNANIKKKMVTVFDWEKYNKAVALGTIPNNLKPKEFTGGKPPMRDFWTDIKIIGSVAKERTGYPTQKPLSLLERVIKASSNENDLVLDPFCGCATTCIAAEKKKRRWIGIDVEEMAFKLVRKRLKNEVEREDMFPIKAILREDIPQRTDIKVDSRKKGEKKHYLFGIQEGRCKGCERFFEFRNFHIDHITPKNKGGVDNIENLQLLCGHCNSVKGNRPMEYLITKLKKDKII